jgi:hypothetical protein
MPDEEDIATAPGASSAAPGLSGASRAKAYAYLDEQTRLARLQSSNLIEQNAFELSHLRWRRFNDQMKGALQILTVLLGLVIAAIVIAALWDASRAQGLVVDAFAVPPALAQAGMSGDVVADDMTAKIAAIRDFANERHLTGNLRNLQGGRIALTVSLDGAQAVTLTGAAGDLDVLEQQAAERAFAIFDPVNIVLYLNGQGRTAEALAAAQTNIAQARSDADLAGAYSLHANLLRYDTGDMATSLAQTRLAIALAPRQAPQHMEMLNTANALGHDEDVLAQARIANRLGPTFADPLELWGEAMIVRNRADLALAKFQAASAHAPNWGRLHLKWGEALLWSGDAAAARAQFALAGTETRR